MRRTSSSPAAPGRSGRGWSRACHRLKHEPGAARQLIRDLKRLAAEKGVALGSAGRRGGDHATSPTRAKAGRMDYPPLVDGEHPDRQRGDGGGVQGAGEAAAVRVGDEVEGAGCGGGAEPAVPDLHDRALVAVLGQDRPVWVPCGGLTVTSIRGHTPSGSTTPGTVAGGTCPTRSTSTRDTRRPAPRRSRSTTAGGIRSSRPTTWPAGPRPSMWTALAERHRAQRDRRQRCAFPGWRDREFQRHLSRDVAGPHRRGPDLR